MVQIHAAMSRNILNISANGTCLPTNWLVSQAQTTMRYAHLANDPLKAAANQIAGAIAATMRGNGAEVVSIKRIRK
jgi:hypothetical protein